MRLAFFSLSFLMTTAVEVRAQARFDPQGGTSSKTVRAFEEVLAKRGKPTLDCSIRTFSPNLGYDLQVWTGYQIGLPAKQFQAGRRATLLNVFRVTPTKPAGETAWFLRRWDLPVIPPEITDKRVELTAGGGFRVGTGEFKVEWVLIDDQDRSCTKVWKIKSNPPQRERLGLQAGFVDDDRRLMSWQGPKPAANGQPTRATILVNAYPVSRRRYISQLSWGDRRLLATAITTTIDRVGFNGVHLIVFDLERRRILFEDKDFNRRGYRQLMNRLGEANLATIDYTVLEEGQSEFEFIASLLSDVSVANQPSDAVVFVAPAWRDGGKKRPIPAALRESVPDVFCVALAPGMSWVTGAVVDFVREMKGRVLNVFQPADLAAASDRIRQELANPSGKGP